MLDWLAIWGVTQTVGFIFKPILEDLAKDAAKDWAKDLLKGIPNKILEKIKKEDIQIAAGKALKEFLQLAQQQLKVRCKLSEVEVKEYTQDFRKFLRDELVNTTLGKAFNIDCDSISSKTLQDSWQMLQLQPLPAKFNWEAITEQYLNQVQEIILDSEKLRYIFELQKLSNIEENTKEIAGIVTDFNLIKYQEGIRERYGNLTLDSLDTTGYAYNELKLWRMFIVQNVREVHQVLPQVYELPKEHIRRLRESGQLEAEIQAEELERHKQVYLEQPIRSVLEIVNDRQTYKYIVILGDPGSGKSTLLQYLALNWANSPLDNVISLPIPLLIELRTYMRRREDKECHNFLEFFHKCSGAITHLNQHKLHEQLKAGNAVIMFDGLDEVFDPGKREDVITDIHRFTNDYPNVQVIVTSRVIGYKPQRLRDAEFRHFMLQDLDSEQIQDFIHRWHELTFSDEADKVKKRERLQRGIENSKAITELAGNPLLLTMMAILNRNQELPRDRSSLYEQASRVLLHQWDVERDLEDKRLDHTTIDYKDKQAMLRQVAYFMQTSAKGQAGNLISANDLEKILTNYLRTLEISQPRQAARVMINQLRTRNFMLCFLGADSYGFVHRTFLEYFCAWEFVWQFKETQTLSIEDLKQEVFGNYWQDETWHEVLLLIAGMIEPKFVGEIIDYLIALDGEEKKFINLFLAAKCLVEVRNRSVIMSTANILLNQLKDLTKYDLWYYYNPLGDDEETQLVQQIRTQAVTAIATTWQDSSDTKIFLQNRAIKDGNSDVRWTAVREFAKAYKDDPTTKTFLQNLATGDGDLDVRLMAVRELAKAYKDDPHTKTFLQDYATGDDNSFVRGMAVRELAKAYKDDPTTKTFLQDCATGDYDSFVRGTAVREFAKAYKDDPHTKTFLQDCATGNNSSYVRGMAVREFAKSYKDDPNTKIFLQDFAIKDDDSSVRWKAVEELAKAYKDDPHTKAILQKLAAGDSNSSVRWTAVQELAKAYKDDPITKTILQKLITGDDGSDVRLTAVRELAKAYNDDPITKTILQNLATEDDDSSVRQTAVQELAKAYNDDPITKTILQNLATDEDDSYVQWTAVQELAKDYNDDPHTKTILQKLATEDDDSDVRWIAVRELAKAYKSQPELFDIYYNCAVNDPFERQKANETNPRRVALEIIVKQFPQNPETLALLSDRAENDADEQVREYAQEKLAELEKVKE